MAQTLHHWLVDPDLSSVRDPDALAALPREERTDWTSSGGSWSACGPGARPIMIMNRSDRNGTGQTECVRAPNVLGLAIIGCLFPDMDLPDRMRNWRIRSDSDRFRLRWPERDER